MAITSGPRYGRLSLCWSSKFCLPVWRAGVSGNSKRTPSRRRQALNWPVDCVASQGQFERGQSD